MSILWGVMIYANKPKWELLQCRLRLRVNGNVFISMQIRVVLDQHNKANIFQFQKLIQLILSRSKTRGKKEDPGCQLNGKVN